MVMPSRAHCSRAAKIWLSIDCFSRCSSLLTLAYKTAPVAGVWVVGFGIPALLSGLIPVGREGEASRKVTRVSAPVARRHLSPSGARALYGRVRGASTAAWLGGIAFQSSSRQTTARQYTTHLVGNPFSFHCSFCDPSGSLNIRARPAAAS